MFKTMGETFYSFSDDSYVTTNNLEIKLAIVRKVDHAYIL